MSQNRVSHPGIIADLQKLLTAQLDGDPNAIIGLRAIWEEMRKYVRESHYLTEACDPGLSIKQSWALMQIVRELEAMFAFSPGRPDGIPPLLKLLKMVNRAPAIDVLYLYRSSSWKKLVAMRGSAETILRVRCKACATEYIVIGTSGFLDIYGLVCDQCGNVWFKDIYGHEEIPMCECGGTYRPGCPHCGNYEREILQEFSPYEYFLTHQHLPR